MKRKFVNVEITDRLTQRDTEMEGERCRKSRGIVRKVVCE